MQEKQAPQSPDYACLAVVVMRDNHGERDPDWSTVADLEICTAKGAEIPPEDTHLLARAARDERPSDLRSELCLSMGADWLDKCEHEHEKCKENQDEQTHLPTRVIDVGSTVIQPRLYLSGDGETGRWVALSYCWGGNSSFVLNSATLDSLVSGIPLPTFPPTLRDAILVTRALGVRYLWIDALCIFQDDINDWAVEVPKVSDIYSHAVVTIAVTSAESVKDGFLDRREQHFNCPFPWRRYHHPSDVTDGPHYPIFFRYPIWGDESLYKQQRSRWATRGWTFQEELLSKRLIRYTTGRMIWHCRAGMAVEPAEEPRTDYELFSKLNDLPPHSSSDADTTDSKTAVYTAWCRLIEKYTKRHLTFQKDRLPAIGAIAKLFHSLLGGDKYCAGWWRENLLFGLLWSLDLQSDGSGTPGSPFLRARLRIVGYDESGTTERAANRVPVGVAPEHSGPSWSWAGVNSAVGLRWPQPVQGLSYVARVASVEMRGKFHDDFGSVEGGELVLNAPYRDVHLRLGSYSGTLLSPMSMAQRVLTRLGPLASTKKLAQIVLTRPEVLETTQSTCSVMVPSSSTEFTFIQLAKRNDATWPTLYLLILQPQMTGRAYRRVGLLVLQPWRYDDDKTIAEEMTDRLEGAAYEEVVKEEWPTGTFVII
ncbi:hypothetical protein DL767_004033 [Monosporascus sp. MG133]|nr:hypothetical protein DL767_004033 [Monosporascus sp. MG133]